MHLIDNVILRIGQGSHRGVGSGGNPCPCTGVGISFYEDGLGCGSCSSDAIDGCLVKVSNEGIVHVVVFIVGVEDDVFVGGELAGDCLPECLEARRVCDYVPVVTTCINELGGKQPWKGVRGEVYRSSGHRLLHIRPCGESALEKDDARCQTHLFVM